MRFDGEDRGAAVREHRRDARAVEVLVDVGVRLLKRSLLTPFFLRGLDATV